MLLAAYAADRNLVEELWRYYINRRNTRGLMNWRIGNPSATACGNTVLGANGATDGDLDVAMALIVAACQWPTYTFNGTNGTATGFASGRTFAQEAAYLIGQIRQFEITVAGCAGAAADYQISNGDGWINGCPSGSHTCRNPSYQSPAYVRLFQAYDPSAPAGFWNNVLGTIYTEILNPNRNTTTGLVSNWSSPAGVPNTCGTPAFLDYGYDAARAPFRIATDYLWFGESQARDNFLQPISNYIRTQTATYTNPTNLRGPVTQAGAHIAGRTTASPDATFTSTWGMGAMGVNYSTNNQATLDFMYNRVRSVKDPLNCTSGSSTGYFGNTLRVVALFMMTGNFWRPCPPRCQGPVFATDSVSTCGETSIVLNSGLATAPPNRTFQWFKNGTSLGAASTTANTLTVNATSPAPNGPGWFRVRVDSAGCSLSDSIYVKSTAVQPELGVNKTLCANTSITLSAGLYSASGYTFTWEYAANFNYSSLTLIPGETGMTLSNVRSAGLYKVTATKPGCATLWDTVRVLSSLVNPVDACSMTAPGNVILSISGPNLGPASQYDWYEVPIGGTILPGGAGTLTYNTANDPTPAVNKPAGVYTYYVHDKSKQFGKVGKPAPTSPPADCGSLSLNPDGITAGWGMDAGNVYSQDWTVVRTIDIDSVTVWYCLYNNTDIFTAARNVTFQLTDATGATAIQTTPARPAIRIVNPIGSYGPPYNGRIQGVRYYVGFTNVAPGTYRIKILSPTTALNALLEQHPTNVYYNYTDNIDGNTAYIRSSFGYSTTFANRYAHFYDWTISAPNNCARIPVIAYIGAAHCPLSLPLQLISFNATSHKNHVVLNWITASEKNAAYYQIERSSDNQSYIPIGYVNAKGNSESYIEYTFTDNNPVRNGNYYRLVLYETNGDKFYSQPVYVLALAESSIAVFPNPADETITIKTNSNLPMQISIISSVGSTVSSITMNEAEATVDVSSLTPGLYLLKAGSDASSEVIRLLIK